MAQAHGIADGDWVRVTTRRGAVVVQASVVRTIRPDTVFIPYHWPGRRSANRPDAPDPGPAQQDPGVQGVGLSHREGARAGRPRGDPSRGNRLDRPGRARCPATGRAADGGLRFLRRPFAVHRLPIVRGGLCRVRHPSGPVDDPRGLPRPAEQHRDGADGVHALRRADVRARLPGRCDQEGGRRGRPQRAEAAMHRVLELRARVSVRRPDSARRSRADDEVRHVLRPDVGRAAAHVRDRVPEPGPELRPGRRYRASARLVSRAAISSSATNWSGRRCS